MIRHKLHQPEAMIFDLDGTLFQSESILLPAYHATFEQLRREGLYEGETPPEERITSCLGMVIREIWRKVLPESPASVHRRADELLLQHQLSCLKRGEGALYPGVEDTLRKLQQSGIRLFIASNGLENYVKLVSRHKGVADLFENLYTAGEYRTESKVDLVKQLLDNHRVQSAWMVGDRSSDVEAGKKNRLFVVGCDYAGFGKASELDGADVKIRSFPELLEL
ncbi:HAD hydrolase-like protein [Paenibacillus aurantius]|uniref:HAD hydrolase-like protein n=1 Tax=Paenibacillus aurantius TaxID=2918900 RepID=A0AA96RDP1_9BACL|nr:HAD hydrolase-like protein [Paenibacillus aurantius]WJH34758.1 HAD hydrolase-like protein [Paenibacillus sp. CC-CFT747]WNQ09972.1 HAD hydrolase-like protein [Paenibacillus aurantius]